MTPLFGKRKQPQFVYCHFCSREVSEGSLWEHYESHAIEVIDVNGDRAYAFDCPRCGPSEGAWGAARENPMAMQNFVTGGVMGHLILRHGLSIKDVEASPP